MHGRLVGADDDAAAAHFLSSRTASSASAASRQQAARVVQQQAPGFGQGAVARGAVEQPLAELFLEPSDGLADGRLGPAELLRGLREASLGRDRDENSEILQLHGLHHNQSLYKSKSYNLDYGS